MAKDKRGSFGIVYIASSLINAYTSYKISSENREFQMKQTEETRMLNQSMELNRQNFQLELNERNAQLQRSLSQKNHENRLIEMQYSFENSSMQAEWQQFLKNWPLVTPPSVIRAEQILPDNTVSMRVIFSKCNDCDFEIYVYPRVQQELREFVDLYPNQFDSKNIIFYHNAFSGKQFGGAVDTNIHYALKELPVIILETEVIFNLVCVSCTVWGLGSSEKRHTTVFKFPYKKAVKDGMVATKYYIDITRKIVAHLKFVIGYAYDVYNLVQYDRPPLLPRVAKFEKEKEAFGCLLDDEDVKGMIGEQYGEVYELAIGTAEDNDNEAWSDAIVNYKKSFLHEIRLNYACEVKEFVTEEEFKKYLDDSASAWCDLRTTKPAEEFLTALADGTLPVSTYFSKNDITYFEKLEEEWNTCQERSALGRQTERIAEILKDFDPALLAAEGGQKYDPQKAAQISVPSAKVTKLSARKYKL